MFMTRDISATLIATQAPRSSRTEKKQFSISGMKTIEEIWRSNLELLIKRQGRLAAFAAKIGKSSGQVSQWKNSSPDSKTGKPRNMHRETARFIEAKMGLPPGWMDVDRESIGVEETPAAYRAKLSLRDDKYAMIPRVLLNFSAGVSGFSIDEVPDIDGKPLAYDPDWLQLRGYKPDKMVVIGISGNSMEPGLSDGDLALVNKADTDPKDGRVYAINYEGELIIKRLKRDAGNWYLSSDNPDKRLYPDKIMDGVATIIGRVVQKQSETI